MAEHSLSPEERARRSALASKVTAYFRAHPLEWIGARELERLGGRQGWRTRVSESRRYVFEPEGGQIENRQDYTPMADGTRFVESWYRYVPWRPLARDGAQLVQPDLFTTNPDRPFAR